MEEAAHGLEERRNSGRKEGNERMREVTRDGEKKG